ncbi:MAG: serine/threonine protein kinase [Proteobacteria bacterium]|jgi:Ser/Thr protein kinase RdoA (MazF antagonist)|nr:serine/threonine protein kinase [Desulfocapsa sp.]MBU3944054.1 serine/threonine protein kinase [Pseudomonadota bacterium]MCG2743533.1 serine/threonine protein kinase [Desulfobacteraceae bacterium]MBU3983970.1 serine/threonine protein kinase [Pseudomonadota bacterium]MBU4029523.1 serine/threonine protein kinase [Pseudomonadota bacterium]
MKDSASDPGKHAFHGLTPDVIITLAEKSLGARCTNLCRPLNSYINRVYELEYEDRTGLVIKFYRPGRWSKKGLLDEHAFLLELADREIPVIAPLKMTDGGTLGQYGKIMFACFPKCGGRSFDEYSEDQWLELGRLIGRVHAIGAIHLPQDRITMVPDSSTRTQVDQLLSSSLIPADLCQQFKELTDALLSEITPLFNAARMIRIHGDCHFSNLIYLPGKSFYIIDFDDMAVGPPVQDFWMLLPGLKEDSWREINLFLEGYETFMNFDQRSLALIEPLRAMRYIHYIAWCAHQFSEDGESRVAPNFGSREYWQQEMGDLADQLERIRNAS